MMRINPGWTATAVSILKEVLSLSRRYPESKAAALQLLITAYAMAGNCDLARHYADQFTLLATNSPIEPVIQWTPRIWFTLGYGYEAVGEYSLSEEAYRKALSVVHLDTGRLTASMVQFNLAQVLLAEGKVDEALGLLTHARPGLNLDRYASDLLDTEAQCFILQGRIDRAWHACEEALAHPSCSDRVKAHVYFTMARVAAARGDQETAAEKAEAALTLAIKNPIARLLNRIEAFRVELSRKKEVS